MCVIRVGGEENEFLEIAINGYTYPGASDYCDGNWLRADVRIAAGGFYGRVTGYVRAEELELFRNQLTALLDTLQGIAEFRTMEGWLSLQVTSDRRGNLTLAAEVQDEPGMAERFQRGIQRALNTPPQHRTKPTLKPKERPASKGRVHKGKTRS